MQDRYVRRVQTEKELIEVVVTYRDSILIDICRKYGFKNPKEFYSRLYGYDPYLKEMFIELIDDIINMVLIEKRDSGIECSQQTILTKYGKS